jgi:hypothetical protein
MPTTPDRFPGLREEERLKLTAPPEGPGEIGYDPATGRAVLWDSEGAYDPRTGGSPSAGIGALIFTIAGGVVYTTGGDVVIKESA